MTAQNIWCGLSLGALLALTAPAVAQPSIEERGPLHSGKSPPPAVVQEILNGITGILEKHAADKQNEGKPPPIRPIVQLTTAKLGITLADTKTLEKDWQRFVRQEGSALQRDVPRQQAKKILVWVLQWLYRHEKEATGSTSAIGSRPSATGYRLSVVADSRLPTADRR